MNHPLQLCTFWLDDHLFGIDVRQVQEVLREVTVTPVPLAARPVSGIFSLRGQNVAAIELRRCLDFSDRPDDSQPVGLIVHTSDGLVGLLADAIGDVVEPDASEFEPAQTSDEPDARPITGVYKLPHALLRVLDISKTVSAVMTQRLENVQPR